MRQFALSEDLLTGIGDIDEDHRALIKIGNKVLSAGFVNTDKTIFEDTLSFLAAYVCFHFAAEEYAMFEAGYPGLEHHRRFHEHFHREISEYVNRGQREGISKEVMVKISFAVENWLFEHIRIMDRAFAKYLREGHATPISLPDVQTLKNAGKLPQDFNEGLIRYGRL